MPASGRIIRGSISSVGESGGTAEFVTVKIIVNGQSTNDVIKAAGLYSNTRIYNNNIELAKNDRINFRTSRNTPNATNTIVSLLIELDL